LRDRGASFTEGCFAISTQVMFEVYVNVTRKAKINLSPAKAFEYVGELAEWPVMVMTPDLALAALSFAQRFRIPPWDAGILVAARQAGCRKVLSEDLCNAQAYEGITVENHFS
jgi:predicted nucleic acid-binding protein